MANYRIILTIFIMVDNPQSGSSALGYMPRSKQAGFIFVDNHGNDPERLVRTMAHELSHGMFNLKHTFSEYSSLSLGATQNLMDYTATGTELLKYQWDYVHDPQKVIPLFEGDEEGESFCTWWYQSVTSRFWGTEADDQIKEKAPLFNHVRENFETYFSESQLDNKQIPEFTEWSVRKSSFSKKNNLTLVERVVQKFLDQAAPTFTLSNKGIFLGKYTIKGTEYKVALYSELENITLGKTQVEDICDLVDHDVIRIVIEDEHILVVFFNERKLQMTLQIMASEDEDAELWLTYLNILKESPSVFEEIKVYWKSLWESSDSTISSNGKTFTITTSQISAIFPNTPSNRIQEVVNVINEYSGTFNIDTKERMAHFLGQIGTESAYLTKLKESHSYSKQLIYETFLKVDRSKTGGGKTYKYCHLIEGYDCTNLASCPSGYSGPHRCSEEPDFLVDTLGNFATYKVWTDSSFSIKDGFENSESLFNLTYCCRLGNGAFDTGDGAKFKGRGFIQITGKGKYNELSNLWNQHFPDDPKDFAGDDYELMESDVRVAIIASMFEWQRLEENEAFKNALDGEWKKDDKGKWITTDIKTISRKVNGSGSKPANGENTRIEISIKAYENL